MNLSRRLKLLVPPVVRHRTRPGMNNKRRDQIGSVKSLGTPIFYGIDQVIVKKFNLETLAKLNPAAAKDTGFLAAGLRFQAKEKTKKR